MNTEQTSENIFTYIKSHISTFSPPLSVLFLGGVHISKIACSNKSRTVSFLLLVEQCRYTIYREKPSIPPWMTNPQRIKLWWLSQCHKLLEPGTLYFLLLLRETHLICEFIGSVLANAFATLCCWSLIPILFKCPRIIDLPVVGPCCTLKSSIIPWSSWSLILL